MLLLLKIFGVRAEENQNGVFKRVQKPGSPFPRVLQQERGGRGLAALVVVDGRLKSACAIAGIILQLFDQL